MRGEVSPEPNLFLFLTTQHLSLPLNPLFTHLLLLWPTVSLDESKGLCVTKRSWTRLKEDLEKGEDRFPVQTRGMSQPILRGLSDREIVYPPVFRHESGILCVVMFLPFLSLFLFCNRIFQSVLLSVMNFSTDRSKGRDLLCKSRKVSTTWIGHEEGRNTFLTSLLRSDETLDLSDDEKDIEEPIPLDEDPQDDSITTFLAEYSLLLFYGEEYSQGKP